MAKEAKRVTRKPLSQADLLLKEQMAAVQSAMSDHRSGVIDANAYKGRLADIMGTAENLDKARQGRLALAVSEASRVPMGSGSRGAIVLAGNRVPSPELITQERPSEMLGGNIRVPAVRIGQAQTPPNPVQQAIVEAQIAAQRVAGEQAARAQRVARVGGATPKIEQAVGKVRIPGYFGNASAANDPEVGEAVARLRLSATPRQAAERGREAIRIARTKATAAEGKPTVGKGLLGAGAGALVTLLATKMMGKKDEIDPQMQMMMMQRLGQAQQGGGGDQSKQLMDLSRALSVVKKLQELSAVQGPAAVQPRLI